MRQGNVPPEPASLSERRLSDAHETISANRHFVQFRARFRGGSSGAPRRARTPPPHTLTGGRGGIRTPEGSHPGGFQDRCLRPLGHPSTTPTGGRKSDEQVSVLATAQRRKVGAALRIDQQSRLKRWLNRP